MSIVDSFKEYIKTEIPVFHPGWLIDDFQDKDMDEALELSFMKKSGVIHLPDIDTNNPSVAKRR